MDPFEQVAARLGPFDGDPVPLDGGITNRNYRWGDCVVRIPGDDTDALGIDRDGERAAARLAHRLGIGPEVLMDEPLVTRFVEGVTLDEAGARDHAAAIRAALKRLHACGETLPTRFDPREVIESYARIAVPPQYEEAMAGAVFEAYEPVPCHNDPLPANFIAAADGQLMIIDWEYAGMGDARFDLASFAVRAGLDTEYPQQRYQSLLFEAMWGAVQAEISSLDFDYKEYADAYFARLAD